MRFLYNILFTLGFIVSAPFYFLKMRRRGNWREGFGQRFGRFNAKVKQAMTNRHVLWIHAVSVGEVNVATQLIVAIERRMPNLKIVVSTTTSTGMGELQKWLPSHIHKIYYPIDRRSFVRRSLIAMHPEAIVLVEAEIWPNFLWMANHLGIPTFLVNARLSPKSYRGYRRFGFLFRSIFASFSGVGCQNEADAERLRQLGCRPESIEVVGSLKFDAAKLEERRLLDVPRLLGQLGVPPDAPIIVGGSTHAGEEGILAESFLRLRQQFPKLFLVVVPRHFERGKEAGREIADKGVRFVYRKDVTPATQHKPGEVDCLLVNTTGELKHFYESATAIFVGKSLTAQGGQNPIEPAALAKPILFGPHMTNFAEISAAFVAKGGAAQVRNVDELTEAFADLLANPDRATTMGRAALAVVRENLGAIERTVAMVVQHLEETDIYVAPE
ncbi:MAG TPA: 3-deoxy-D-manno-octulosonic acid transferase [Verrucomicrobiae bacterium]|nr:3-deoxy-D-manno-octulosonic acid transferase [Verrucomicrobiae bacterium]